MVNQVHSPDNKQHKKRVSKACDCCRKSKTKCDGQRPCTRCLQDNKICTYMTNKKKIDKTYSSTYVDLLETRVSILIQSMTQLLQKAKSPMEISQFINNSNLYNDDDEIDMNKVICSLLSTEKLKNLSQSNHDYTIDEITNVQPQISTQSNDNSDSSNSNTPITQNIPISKKHHHSVQKDQEISHIHKPHRQNSHTHSHSYSHSHSTTRHHYKSPTSSSFDLSNQSNINSLLYNDTTPSISLNTDLTNSDDNHSITSSIMSPNYSINENFDPLSNLQIQDSQPASIFENGTTSTNFNLNEKLIDGPVLDNNYGFNWDQFELNNKVKDEFQLIPEFNSVTF
ncbi:Lactose regulatory protein LAC9 [Wickerhamomyces ciferrii]|uniref:Lactose regulatory protein LAC9 n=1 Tax=Wickerhamomyces ciferrii (strain ATCC 14091 / BCRC 22168 / CBS 111 / JCM 3599 / NBRC 0793 / NRRL Y-1031 F-60-10) TaxID=1206466 RepID=K0KSB0_WICCF|nr:Lactose regulatory protein LAC9 [Wickerhamomyces ciferrii]CCH44223.1 Lactose regulatory protein LAC9 [Wickerhamomyces ciferrii]